MSTTFNDLPDFQILIWNNSHQCRYNLKISLFAQRYLCEGMEEKSVKMAIKPFNQNQLIIFWLLQELMELQCVFVSLSLWPKVLFELLIFNLLAQTSICSINTL